MKQQEMTNYLVQLFSAIDAADHTAVKRGARAQFSPKFRLEKS